MSDNDQYLAATIRLEMKNETRHKLQIAVSRAAASRIDSGMSPRAFWSLIEDFIERDHMYVITVERID